MCDREEPLRNNNLQEDTQADGNANDIRTDDGGRTGGSATLSDQDKVVIWGTHSQCDDPELAEFEMLECQELEAYLVEDGEDFVGLKERNNDPLPSSSRTTAEAAPEQSDGFASAAMDNKGRTCKTENTPKMIEPCVDLNWNSTLHSKDLDAVKHTEEEHRRNNNHFNKAFREATERKASPIKNANNKKSTQADEHSNGSASPRKTKASPPKVVKKQAPFDNSLKKQNSFERSFKKQPSFEYTFKKQHSFDNSTKKPQGSFENVSRSSSLERRKPWGSSGHPAAPSSPRRQPPASPAKVLSVQSAGCSSPQRTLTTKPPKTNLSSGIPKPVAPVDVKRSSPPAKPKNVRPKIITCVRKNPQGTDVPLSHTTPPTQADPRVGTAYKGSSNTIFDKYRQEMSGPCPSGLKPASYYEDTHGKCPQEQHNPEDGGYRSPRAARPQLGLGAVTRQPAAKTRLLPAGQRESTGDHRRSGPETSPRNILIKSGQTGLRPPGFSTLPGARNAAVGVGRSVSSTSSGQINGDNTCRTSQPSKKEMKDTEKSSPKSCAVVSPRSQSLARGRSAVQTSGAERAQELDRALIKLLRERCEQQARQLQSLQAQLKKASLCMNVFAITTQHFCHKAESAAVREGELSHELARIRDEVAFSVAHWEQLQREKQELERRFEAELQGLRAQQQSELGALEERLRVQHSAETRSLRALQRAQLDHLRGRQQEEMEEMNENHQSSLVEMEATHNDTLATLQEEHSRTVKNLKMAHEQQRKSLEEDFEKIRLSLQDQVDMLTFQNRSLRDRAKRFEEALRKSTDDQIVDALAPYKHIEEDLKSLKEVLEMKNQQIHQQELKITELEKIAEKNVHLEERVQVLQQQNEDLRERIDKNLAVSRQLSEENANLQVHVEKESTEKKRLSRTNEELLWRLQTGELSPRMSPSCSPVHRPPSGPDSPARPHSYHQ
ncbi:microtubule-associated tumor suppressor candidate 2 isoform X2 [Dunckerocampus dactyliophorus]|uniref:microtubule-associated tumor suppressor candidate 2 isoform X2 n=1 Tax=Dunckerocampus dactyliophorus TaxID=161453 RepID=UPI0024055408|nr:microtubule-associated tumor suppressor candidate 2 isoform X2 [Dunckerocampus dactyliophorus]